MREIELKDFPDALYIEIPKKDNETIWNKLLRKNTVIQIAKIQQIPIRNLYKWKEGNSGYPLYQLRKLLKLSNLEVNEITVKTQRDSKPIKNIKLPIRINEEFASFLGHLLGDGGIDNKLQLHYTTNNKKSIKKFRSLVKRLFNTEPNEVDYGNRITLIYPKTLGVIVSSLIDIYGGSKVDADVHLPDKILSIMDKQMKIAFIKSFYECDGESNNIAIVQGCKYLDKPPALLQQIRNLLESLGFKSAIIRSSSIYNTAKGRHRRWVLRIKDKKEKFEFRKLFF